jgi:hypothetical protein
MAGSVGGFNRKLPLSTAMSERHRWVEKTHSSVTKADIGRHLVANVGNATLNGRTFPGRPPSAPADDLSYRTRSRTAVASRRPSLTLCVLEGRFRGR